MQLWIWIPVALVVLVHVVEGGVSVDYDWGIDMNEPSDYWPENYKDHPNGYWFGIQSLSCQHARRRGKRWAPYRSIWRYVHRALYFKGKVYEWGAGGVRYGPKPAIPTCKIEWEASPAWEETTCTQSQADEFARTYKQTYGGYTFMSNNCHKFANRLSTLLYYNCED